MAEPLWMNLTNMDVSLNQKLDGNVMTTMAGSGIVTKGCNMEGMDGFGAGGWGPPPSSSLLMSLSSSSLSSVLLSFAPSRQEKALSFMAHLRRAMKEELERKETERKEMERKETERKEMERKETERKEAERKETEDRETERKEMERKESKRKESKWERMERKEMERKEMERKEMERKDTERKETGRKESVRKEIEKKEMERKEMERMERKKRKEMERKDIMEGTSSPVIGDAILECVKRMDEIYMDVRNLQGRNYRNWKKCVEIIRHGTTSLVGRSIRSEAIGDLRRCTERKETERKETERKEMERKEIKRKELERKEMERKEFERKELERKEMERKETERKEMERKDIESKKTEGKEMERKKAERKESDNKRKKKRRKFLILRESTPPPSSIPGRVRDMFAALGVGRKDPVDPPTREEFPPLPPCDGGMKDGSKRKVGPHTVRDVRVVLPIKETRNELGAIPAVSGFGVDWKMVARKSRRRGGAEDDLSPPLPPRPFRKRELIVAGLDASVAKCDVMEALCYVGGCLEEDIRMGTIRIRNNGIGTMWVQLPMAAAFKAAKKGCILVGRITARVELLGVRPLQCFRCWSFGHAQNACRSEANRWGACYGCGQMGHISRECKNMVRCVVCDDEGMESHHRLGGPLCAALRRQGNSCGRRT